MALPGRHCGGARSLSSSNQLMTNTIRGLLSPRPISGKRIEPGLVPASDVKLTWWTFDQAADQAGVSRRLGGIHVEQGDLESREMGQRVGQQVWRKALRYFDGHQK